MVRTTLEIENDVLAAAKELARLDGTTAGKVISDLARRGLEGVKQKSKARTKNGIPILASRGEVITSEHVRALMDADGV